ncbi:thermonuclease family protein [Nostoc punctiforme]|jgi:endonuclease YncB( thermonuclease family)|uniref:Nuclease (SNase domain protein) n=1 Tax=Nostoc punctiforme (strain ATCC 29133 / PCC 73102) TaxID=63737 RepID=B2JAU4_NOSP7|nr:thermonuclease family protein [Nostoc punctiforme]ACC85048.1 nuclease (SNase domain protein) [Nostoc punctiforme PCC 73102]
MKPLWKTLVILTAIAGATIIAISIFQRTNQPSIALTEEWIATQVADGDSITVRQTDGSQMSVELCGIDAPEMKQGEVPAQALSNKAKQKLLKLAAAANNQLMIIPVAKDSDGRTVAEVMARGESDTEISFQEELLKSGLAKTRLGGVECPNQIAFENAQRLAIASKTGVWSQDKRK